jgi:hypothetical protein
VPSDSVLSVEDATTAGQKRADMAANVVGALGGLFGGGFQKSSTKAFVVTVDPARFRTDVGGAMASVDVALAQQAVASINAAR